MRGEKRAARKRKKNAETSRTGPAPRRRAASTRAVINGGEACDERLHGKGKTVDDGADDEATEGKRERMAEQGGDAAAECGARSEQNEKEKAENRGRQNHGQRSEGLDERRASGCGRAR